MDQKKIIKVEVTKNYIIEKYRDPPNVIKYVKKEIDDKDGFRNLATLAVVKDGDSTKTVITSFWRPINKPSAKRLLKQYLANYPKKVKFKDKEMKSEYLSESYNNRSITKFLFESNFYARTN